MEKGDVQKVVAAKVAEATAATAADVSTLRAEMRAFMGEMSASLSAKDDLIALLRDRLDTQTREMERLQRDITLLQSRLQVTDIRIGACRKVHTIKGHKSFVKVLVALENGCVASGSNDKTIKIWDPAMQWDCVATCRGHDSTVSALCEADGVRSLMLVSGAGDNTLRVWDPTNGYRCIATLSDHDKAVTCVTSLKECIISGSADTTLKVWDSAAFYRQTYTMKGHKGKVWAVVVVRETLVCSGAADNTIRIWDSRNSYDCIVAISKEHEGPIWKLSLWKSRVYEGKEYLMSACGDHIIRLFDPDQKFDCVCKLGAPPDEGHTKGVYDMVELGKDSSVLATGAVDGTIRLWDVDEALHRQVMAEKGTKEAGFGCHGAFYECIGVIEGHTGAYCAITAAHGCLFSCGRSVEISVWDGFNNTEMYLRGEKSQPIEDLRRILDEQQRNREEEYLRKQEEEEGF